MESFRFHPDTNFILFKRMSSFIAGFNLYKQLYSLFITLCIFNIYIFDFNLFV